MDEATAEGFDAGLAPGVRAPISIDVQALKELHSRGSNAKSLGVAVLATAALFVVIAIGFFIYAQFNAPLSTFSDVDVPADYGIDDVEAQSPSSGGAHLYNAAADEILSLLESPVFTFVPGVMGVLMVGLGVFNGDMGRIIMGVICMSMGLLLPQVVRTIAGDTGSLDSPAPPVVSMAREHRWSAVVEHARSASTVSSSYVCSQAAYLAGSNDDLRECLSHLKDLPDDVEVDSRRLAVMARRAGMESLAATHDAPVNERHVTSQSRSAVSGGIAVLLLALGSALTLFARQLLHRHERLIAHSDRTGAAEQP